ncbi:MAG TPA: cupin domain-containing protein [Abditibacteriaceae bacterium]
MIDKSTVQHYKWGNNCDGWHLLKSADLSVIHERMPPGTSETKHLHRVSRQFFFVLSGVIVIEMDGQREELHASQGVEVNPGTAHQVFNTSDSDAEFLVVSQPPSHADRETVA